MTENYPSAATVGVKKDVALLETTYIEHLDKVLSDNLFAPSLIL